MSLDESDSETESIDWDELAVEAEDTIKTSTATVKGKSPDSSKAKTPPTAAEKGKSPMQSTPISMKRKSVARKRGRARGVVIEEPLADEVPPQEEDVQVSTERIKAFENRECIGERHVNLAALRDRSATFGKLIDLANLSPVCTYPESFRYCLHLVRMFYTNARELQENEDGPMEFFTTVCGTKLKITPRLIGEVIVMRPSMSGPHYLKGKSMTNASWRTVVDGICMPDTLSSGNSVYSKELRPEYRFLNFIVCYNILPNMQTKVLRWDRMLFLYLLGHPTEAVGLNVNIPYLIWNRMARYVEHPHQPERLPFPLIIMRILRKFKVDTRSSSYQHSLGTINDTTVVKSLPRQPDDTPTPPRGKKPSTSTPSQSARQAPAPAPAATTTTQGPTSDDEASVTSIYREQQRLSSEQERIAKEQEHICQELEIITASQVTLTKKYNSIKKLVKKMFTKMGCSSSEDSESEG